jgi:hypothetical protein
MAIREYMKLLISAFTIATALSSIFSIANASQGITIQAGSQLALAGLVDPVAVNNQLANQGLQFESTAGFPVAYVLVNDYRQTTYSAYREFMISLPVSRIGEAALDRPSVYLTYNVVNSPSVASVGRSVWGTAYTVGVIESALSNSATAGSFVVSTHGQPIIRVSLGKSSQPLTSAQLSYSTYGYSSVDVKPQDKYKVDVAGLAYSRPFDPSVDAFEIHASGTGDFLKAVGFQPISWQALPSLTGFVAEPGQ